MLDKAFTYLESFYRQTELMDDAQALRYFRAICAFAFDGVCPDFKDDPVLAMAWVSTESAIEANLQARANGKKGGRPKKGAVETMDKTGVLTPLKTQEKNGFEAETGIEITPLKTPLKPNKRKVKEIKVNKRKEDEEKARREQLEKFYSQTVTL